MKLRFEKVLVILFIALLAVIILPILVFYHYDSAFNQTSIWISHTQNVLRQTEEIGVLSRKLVLESNTYLLTKKPEFESDYQDARDKIGKSLPAFLALPRNTDYNVAQFDSISTYIGKLVSLTDSSIALFKQNQLSGEGLQTSILQRRFYLDKVVKLVSDIEARERVLLYERNAHYKNTLAAYNKVFVAYVVLVIILLVSSFISIRTNLRKKKLAEERQRLSEEELRSLINSVKDYAIFRLDRNGTILNWNAGAENLLGYTETEIVGRSFWVFYAPEDRNNGEPEKNLTLTIRQGHLEEESWRIRKDGSRFWANVYMIATHDSHGTLNGFTKVVRDFSIRKQLDEEKNRALEKEKELNKMKSNFVAMASHEFKTPLTSIQLAANAISTFRDQKVQEKYIDKIITNVGTLMSILEEFLSLEKMEEGKMVVNSDVFNIREVTEKVCEEAKLTDTHQVICTHEGESLFCLDRMIYKQILTNLVSNAIKYSPEDSSVFVSTASSKPLLTIKVRDHGIGILPEDQKHLFERFFRASNVTGIKGTGLGLHLVKGYVDMLDGSIDIKSEPGKGTEVTVVLKEQVC
ncbi:MAG TPA: ATP-binding protein [Sphingobacteriaceae bacterium]